MFVLEGDSYPLISIFSLVAIDPQLYKTLRLIRTDYPFRRPCEL